MFTSMSYTNYNRHVLRGVEGTDKFPRLYLLSNFVLYMCITDSEDSRKYYTYDRDELLSFRKYNQAPEELLKAECFRSQKDSL